MICGVIAEFNIFHNGHKYLLSEARKHTDAVVAVMSGDFVQRGDVAIFDKYTRARAALQNGADLVLELPTCYALNAAPNFASGGVGILDALGVVDALIFGSECGDTDALKTAALKIENESEDISEAVRKGMSEGMSYPAALSAAHGDNGLLSQSNNILAVEYIRALTRRESRIRPITLPRVGCAHDSADVNNSYASASHIRALLRQGADVSRFIPCEAPDMKYSRSLSRLDTALTAKLRTVSPEKLSEINEVSEGLENRLIETAMCYDTFEEIAAAVKCKRYTLSRIRRALIAALLDFTKDIYTPDPEYIRVLGMTGAGAAILKEAKNKCAVPIITKTADYKGKSKSFDLDIRAGNIAALCSADKSARKGGADFTTSPIIL